MDAAMVGNRHTEPVLTKPGGGIVASRMPGSFRHDPTTRPEFPAVTESARGGSDGV